MKGIYAVTLTAHGNIDHGQNPYAEVAERTVGYGDTIEELQNIVRNYIEDNCLGGGNWTGGDVYELDTETNIGYISYNGRFWPAKTEKK